MHTVQELVKKGYNVVGSVRSVEKGEYVKKAAGGNFSYEIVENITDDGAFDEFVKKHSDATVFLHTASPFHYDISDVENDFLKPAVYGTKNALQAIKKYGPNIKRVVITSSFAAIASRVQAMQPDLVLDENSWNDLTWEKVLENPSFGYNGSKAFAEKAAWEFVKNEKPNFVLSTVNPVLVFGPQPTDHFDPEKINTSSGIINNILKSKSPKDEVTSLNALAVDVRDVAKAHLVAFEKDEAKEKRLFLTSGLFTQQTILNVLHKEFPKQTENVPVGEPGSEEKEIAKAAKRNNDKTRALLGFELISVEQTIADSARQLLQVEGRL